MRRELVQKVRGLLAQTGFLVSEPSNLRPMAFDIVARRDDDLLIVKVLTNVDSLSPEVAGELKVLAEVLEADPLLVGERASSRDLEPGVIYARHGIPIVTSATLEEHLLEGVRPLVYAAPGGYYVNIDGETLHALREERGLSLGDLASAAGVSRRAISMYEEGMGAMVDVAAKLEEFLQAPLVEALDPFDPPQDRDEELEVLGIDELADDLVRRILHRMQSLGFQIVPVGRVPFNAISRDADGGDPSHLILTGVSDLDGRLVRRAKVMSNVSEVTERASAVFVRERRTKVEVEGTPLIDREELERLDGPDAILELIKERQPRNTD